MRKKLRLLLMGISLHILLSGFLLGLLRVCQSGYDHTHSIPVEPASLRISGDTAVLSLLTQSVELPVPENTPESRLLCFALTDQHVRIWALLLEQFTKQS